MKHAWSEAWGMAGRDWNRGHGQSTGGNGWHVTNDFYTNGDGGTTYSDQALGNDEYFSKGLFYIGTFGVGSAAEESAVAAEEILGETTTVYRNFGWNEYNAFRANGNAFEIGSNFGSKQFWLDEEGINWWNSTEFSKNFTAEININNSVLEHGTEFLDVGRYRAISFDSQEALDVFNQNMKINWIQYK